MATLKISQFITSTSNTPEELKKAVIKQMLGIKSFAEDAQDIVDHGAAGGFTGFIYYSDTTKFYSKNRNLILSFAREQAEDIGYSTVADMVAAFNCIDLKPHEVEYVLAFGEKSDDFTHLANGLAWFALEEVARDYMQWRQG